MSSDDSVWITLQKIQFAGGEPENSISVPFQKLNSGEAQLFEDLAAIVPMGDRTCYRDYCPDCDAQVTIIDDECPDCGRHLEQE